MNNLKNLFDKLFENFTAEQKQRIKIFLIAVLIILIIFAIVSVTSKKPKKRVKIKKENLYKLKIIPEDLKKDIEKHRLVYKVKILQREQIDIEKKVRRIERNVDEIQKKLKKLIILSQESKKVSKKLKKISQDIKESSKQIKKLTKVTEQLILQSKIKDKERIKKLLSDNRTFNQRVKQKKERQFYVPVNNPEKLVVPGLEENKKNKSNKPQVKSDNKYDKKKPQTPQKTEIHVFSEKKNKINYKEVTKKIKIKIAAGSFINGILLTGLDAPTAGSAQSNPVPVLIKIEKDAVMPNRYRMDIKGCFIIAAGYGDLSTERAYIRTETLSCITNDGKNIEVKLKGHVVDMDGKMGLRGRLVSKSGQLIAKSLLAGFMSGIAKIFKPEYIPAVNVEPGSRALFQTPKLSDVFLSGTLSGTNKALDRIANYYIKMAEKIYPVIEVQAGRPVEIIVLKGQNLITRNKKVLEPVKKRGKK